MVATTGGSCVLDEAFDCDCELLAQPVNAMQNQRKMTARSFAAEV